MTDQLENQIEDHIRSFGWHAQYVAGDDVWPAFAYSIGWGITRDWPEMIVVGQRMEVCHGMLQMVWESGQRPVADAARTDVLPEFTCCLKPVHLTWYPFLFGRAIDAYMKRNLPAFPALQCIWPTTSGILPWDANAPAGFDQAQPLLNEAMEREPGT